jgi:hypothetical protein
MSITTNEMLFKNLTELSSTDSGTVTTVQDFKVIEVEDDFSLFDEKTPEEIKLEREAARNNEATYLQRYASFENLAQNLAYDSKLQYKKEGESVIVKEADGREASYYVRRLQTQNAGLVAHVLTPVNPTRSFDVKVLFRGTDPGSLSSVARDLESNGAGSESFAKHKFTLLRQVNEMIKEKNPSNLPTALTVAGHSLGGADTQNFATAVMDSVANYGSLYPELAKLQKLTIFTANSAGVPQATAEQAAKLVADLAELRKEGKTNLTIESYNKRVGGDGVQQTGETHILSNVPAEHAKVDVLKAHIGTEKRNLLSMATAGALVASSAAVAGPIGAATSSSFVAWNAYRGISDTAKAHTEVLFKKEAVQATYDRLSNATAEGQLKVHEQLSKKSSTLNRIHNAAYQAASLASTVLQGGTKAIIGTKTVVSEVASVGFNGLSKAWKRVTSNLTQPNVGDAPTVSPFLFSTMPGVVTHTKPSPVKKGWFSRFGF